jgi:hypothetical protein
MRNTIYDDDRFTIITGEDHMCGHFIQIYDTEAEDDCPSGEGIILEWSSLFGYQTNNSDIANNLSIDVWMDVFKIKNNIILN